MLIRRLPDFVPEKDVRKERGRWAGSAGNAGRMFFWGGVGLIGVAVLGKGWFWFWVMHVEWFITWGDRLVCVRWRWRWR